MFSRLFSSRKAPAPQLVPAIPPGQRVYAVGDLHGRLDLLEEILVTLDDDDAHRGAAQTTLIFLGDLIDRGPDSALVVERLRRLAEHGAPVRFLMGNHEEVFLKAASGDVAATRFLHRIGGDTTIMSYGMSPAEYAKASYEEIRDFLVEAVPQAHIAFLQSFEDQIVIGDYAFVHAGISPGVPLAEQTRQHLRWIRESFLDHEEPFEKFIVHGHTITDEVDERPNRLGIDTGAYATGRLTAIGFEATDRWICQTGQDDARAA